MNNAVPREHRRGSHRDLYRGQSGRSRRAPPVSCVATLPRALVVIAALALGLAGCGGQVSGGGSQTSKNAPVQPGARVILVTASSFSFTPNVITVTAGENVAIRLRSDDAFHTFTIQGQGTVVSVNAGQIASGGFRLRTPGRYVFYCSVPGHRAAGMVGTIIVQ